MKEAARSHLEELIRRYPTLAQVRDPVRRAAELIIGCYHAGGKVLICGNGGSAADAEHIVGELMKGFRLPRPLADPEAARLRDAGFADWAQIARSLQRGLRAVSLAGAHSLCTAVINDCAPEMVFAQQVFVLGRPGDVLVALSTSGSSRNIIMALKVAKAFGLATIGMCGGRPCKMDMVCDCPIHVPETETHKVQELHLPVYHALCLAIEEEFFGQA